MLIAETRVTHYAVLGRGVGFSGRGHIFVGGTLLGRVPRLAICLDGDDAWWLAHCGRTWNVRTAFAYASLADAQAAAERRYPGSASRWKRTGYSQAKAEAYLDRVWKGKTCTFCGRRPDQAEQMFLDLLRDQLQALSSLCEAHQIERLGQLTTTLRIGVHEIDRFTPGSYSLGPGDIEPARRKGRDVVDVDSGAIVVTGLDSLPAVAKVLTSERYDALLGVESAETARWLAKDAGPALRDRADRCRSALQRRWRVSADPSGTHARRPRRIIA